MSKTRIPTLALFAVLAVLGPGCANNSVPDAAPAPAESVSAKHILVQYEGSMRASPDIARTKEEAKARIDECLEKARQGATFEDLAVEYSDGPSAPKGGDLGSFGRNMMAPPFEMAAFSCEVGEVTEVVETGFGYHIIYRYE